MQRLYSPQYSLAKKDLDVPKVIATCLHKYGVEVAVRRRHYRDLTQFVICKPVCTAVSESYPAEDVIFTRLPDDVVGMILAADPQKERSSALRLS